MPRLALGVGLTALVLLAAPSWARAQDGGVAWPAGKPPPPHHRADAPPVVPPTLPPIDTHHVADDPAAQQPTEPQGPQVPTTVGQAAISPTLPVASIAGWILPPDPAPVQRHVQAEQQLEEWLDEQLNGDRLQALGAAPYYHELMRSMRRAWRPDVRELERHRRASMNPAQVVVDELHRYASGPQGPPGEAQMPQNEIFAGHGPGSQETAAANQLADINNLNNAPVTWTSVQVRVTQSPDGRVISAWVTSSSGDPAFDDQVLSAIHTGSMSIPPPPPTVAGGREAIRSDWSFDAGDVATYWNQAGCVDDPVHDEVQCAALGRGIVRTRIRLLRVVDATHDTPEELRAHRQRQPPVLQP